MQNRHPDTSKASIRKPLTRRQAISLLGGAAGAALLAGCGAGNNPLDTGSSTVDTGSGSGGTTPTTGSCTTVAQETGGPFPADGTNTNSGVVKNVLTDSRIFRTDIRSDLDGTNTQTGIPLTLTMTLQNTNNSCEPLAGHYVYIWHCSRTGNYSQYSGAMNGGDYSARSFLRGVGVTDANGQVTFTTVFPGRYSGRATHIHFEVYPDNTPAHSEVLCTSQLAFPTAITDAVYVDTTDYPSSATNNTSNSQDGVFSDGTSTEMLSVTGSNAAGYVASITVAVAA